MIHIVARRECDDAIGRDGKLLYRVPGDLRHFRQATLGHVVLMGRKTFESIGRPLPGRTNVVLSRSKRSFGSGVHAFASLPEAEAFLEGRKPGQKVFVIGGAEVYKLTAPSATELLVTTIRDPAPWSGARADTFYLWPRPYEEWDRRSVRPWSRANSVEWKVDSFTLKRPAAPASS